MRTCIAVVQVLPWCHAGEAPGQAVYQRVHTLLLLLLLLKLLLVC
jgi:hypothetical protein